jgi:hypothetical protein
MHKNLRSKRCRWERYKGRPEVMSTDQQDGINDGPIISGLLAVSLLFQRAEAAERALLEAHKVIGELQKKLADKVALEIAEKSFGYERPVSIMRVVPMRESFRSTPSLFKKTNTEVLVCKAIVRDDYLKYGFPREHEEQCVKEEIIDNLWTELQKRGSIRQFQSRVDYGTVFTVGIEVAKA